MEVDYTTYNVSDNGLPDDVGEVIKLLKAKFPDSLPDRLTTTDEMSQLIGQQDVIRFLNHNYRSK